MNAKPVDHESPGNLLDDKPLQQSARGQQFVGAGRFKPWHSYVFAIVTTAATLGLRVALDGALGGQPTLVIFTLPIMLSAYLGGLRGGFMATALSYFFACFYVLAPTSNYRVAPGADRWQLFFVILVGVVISALNEALHRARARANIATREHLEADKARFKAGALERAIFSSANFSCIATDVKGVIQLFNVGAERMLGYTAADVVNKITPADLHDSQEVIARAAALSLECATPIAPGFDALVFKAARGIEDIYELTKIRKDGTRFPAVVSVTALRDAKQHIIGYLLIGTDNTARKQVDYALRESKAELQTIIENISEAVVVADLNGQLLHFNHAALEMMGYASLDEGRRKFGELADTFELSSIDGAAWPVDQWPLARILRGEKLHDLEARMRRIGADWERIYNFGGTIARDAGGDPLMAIVTFSDITERKRAEAARHLSEARISGIVNSAMDAIISIDTTQHIVLFNAAAEKMFGCTADDALGQPLEKFIPERFREAHRHHVDGFGTTGTTSRSMKSMNTLSGLRADGEEFPIEASISQVEFVGQRIFTVILRDITGRKRAETSLRESEERFRTLANSIPQLAWTARADGFINWYNERWYTYTGTTPEQMEGWGWQAVHDPEVLPKVMDRWGAAIAAAALFEMEFPLRGVDGRFRTFLTRVQPLKDSQGQVVQWFGTNTDVETLKQAEEEIHLLNTTLEQRVVERTAQLQIANNELEAFCYSVSHDLRAPLRSIDGFSLALLEDSVGKLDEESQDHLCRIRAATQQMGHLIDDLLSLSRMTRVEMRRERVNLSTVAREVVDELRSSGRAREVDVVITDGLYVEADASLLRIVLTNLLGNAWKFTGERARGLIEFGCCAEEGEIGYFVRDNGVGFDMTYAGKLFGAFQRLHSATQFPGTGIGLATVQRIVQRHGGRVWAEADAGKGATFHFSLSAAA